MINSRKVNNDEKYLRENAEERRKGSSSKNFNVTFNNYFPLARYYNNRHVLIANN